MIKTYEKTIAYLYELAFLPNWAQNKMSLDRVEKLVDQMDSDFEKEWRYIRQMYGFSEETDEKLVFYTGLLNFSHLKHWL